MPMGVTYTLLCCIRQGGLSYRRRFPVVYLTFKVVLGPRIASKQHEVYAFVVYTFVNMDNIALSIRKILLRNINQFMSSREIRDAMLSWNPPKCYSSYQIAHSICYLPEICNGDYEIKYDKAKGINIYRIISYS